MRRALNLTLIHLIRFPLNHSHLVLTRQFHSEGKPMTPPETCKKAWSEPLAFNSADNFSLHYWISCIFIIWSHVLRQPRFWSSPASLRCDGTRQGCRQIFAKNKCQKTETTTQGKTTATTFRCLLSVKQSTNARNGSIYSWNVPDLTSSSNYENIFLADLELLDRCCCCCCCCFFFARYRAIVFGSKPYPLTWIAQIGLGRLVGCGLLILSNTFLLE